MTIVEVPAEATHDLRARVLRDGTHDDVVWEQDDVPGTFHLAALDEGVRIVGIASFHPTDDGWQLRGMAVDPALHGAGVGQAILAEAATRLRGQRLWAWCRDSALGFYERLGWRIVGEGWDTPHGPHHLGEIQL